MNKIDKKIELPKISNMKISGFTLIELVMVIVILGILSSFALPKYLDLQQQARHSVIVAAHGTLAATMSIVYVKSAVIGENNSPTGSVTLDDGTVINTVYGYPSRTEIRRAADMDDPPLHTSFGGGIVANTYHIDAELTCKFFYYEATSTTSARITPAPDISSC